MRAGTCSASTAHATVPFTCTFMHISYPASFRNSFPSLVLSSLSSICLVIPCMCMLIHCLDVHTYCHLGILDKHTFSIIFPSGNDGTLYFSFELICKLIQQYITYGKFSSNLILHLLLCHQQMMQVSLALYM